MHPESNIQRVRHRTSSALLKGLAASLVFSSQHPSFATQKGAANDVVQSLADIKSSAQFIETHCTKILQATKRTGRLLYRGRDSDKSSVKDQSSLVISESSDLLEPDTYGSILAAQYFNTLDQYISTHPRAGLEYFQDNEQQSTAARPSNGHIATSSIDEAGKWGAVYSCWPIDEMHYTYLKSYKLFWKDSWGTLTTNDGKLSPLFWKDASAFGSFCSRELVIDRGLEGSLEKGNEVLFTRTMRSSNSDVKGDYLLVPISQEGKLIRELGIEPYGAPTDVKTVVTEVESDEIVSKVRRTKNGKMACMCTNGKQYCSECVKKFNTDTSYKSTISVFPLPP